MYKIVVKQCEPEAGYLDDEWAVILYHRPDGQPLFKQIDVECDIHDPFHALSIGTRKLYKLKRDICDVRLCIDLDFIGGMVRED